MANHHTIILRTNNLWPWLSVATKVALNTKFYTFNA